MNYLQSLYLAVDAPIEGSVQSPSPAKEKDQINIHIDWIIKGSRQEAML